MPPILLGLENCLRSPPRALAGARFGLLANQASVDREFRYAHELLAERFGGQLTVLFSPQHGLWSEEQDNMIESPHGREPRLGLPVWSLYSDGRKPAAEMLDGLDALVVDLQDVGTRVYTYAWTVTLCLEACAARGIPVVILDRPNPLGGRLAEGLRLQPGLVSFVGRASIPMRHGLTIGELATYLNRSMAIDAEVSVVPVEGWTRDLAWSDIGRPWVPPSPNLPRSESVLPYAGQVLLEGTNLSEGRGTTTPFEIAGAPFIDGWRFADALGDLGLEGVAFRPIRFRPTFQKWSGELCEGVFLHVTDAERFRPVHTAVSLLACARRLWPEDFRWLPPPFEYECEKMPIDILAGTSALREALGGGASPDEAAATLRLDEDSWWEEARSFLLY